jgi:hypothetical protein
LSFEKAKTFDLSNFRSLTRSNSPTRVLGPPSTHLVTAEAPNPSTSANTRFVIPVSLPNTTTA